MVRSLFLTILLIFSSIAAASAQKFGVWVSHTGEDQVGDRLAFEIREELGRSNRYKEASYREASFQIFIATMAAEENSGANWSIGSVTYTMASTDHTLGKHSAPLEYLSSQVISVGRTQVKALAQDILASFDKIVNEPR